MLLSLYSMRVYSGYSPFILHSHDRLVETAQWQLFFTLLGALCMRVDIVESYLQYQFDLVMTGLQFVLLVLIGFQSTLKKQKSIDDAGDEDEDEDGVADKAKQKLKNFAMQSGLGGVGSAFGSKVLPVLEDAKGAMGGGIGDAATAAKDGLEDLGIDAEVLEEVQAKLEAATQEIAARAREAVEEVGGRVAEVAREKLEMIEGAYWGGFEEEWDADGDFVAAHATGMCAAVEALSAIGAEAKAAAERARGMDWKGKVGKALDEERRKLQEELKAMLVQSIKDECLGLKDELVEEAVEWLKGEAERAGVPFLFEDKIKAKVGEVLEDKIGRVVDFLAANLFNNPKKIREEIGRQAQKAKEAGMKVTTAEGRRGLMMEGMAAIFTEVSAEVAGRLKEFIEDAEVSVGDDADDKLEVAQELYLEAVSKMWTGGGGDMHESHCTGLVAAVQGLTGGFEAVADAARFMTSVPSTRFKVPGSTTTALEKGQAVEGNRGGGEWSSAKIRRVREDKYNLIYDGEKERGVSRENIRVGGQPEPELVPALAVGQHCTAQAKAQEAQHPLEVGTQVEALYKANTQNKWFSGKITACTGPKYIITYEDGETEQDVAEGLIRLKPAPFLPAKISAVNADGSIDAELCMEWVENEEAVELVEKVKLLDWKAAGEDAKASMGEELKGFVVQWIKGQCAKRTEGLVEDAMALLEKESVPLPFKEQLRGKVNAFLTDAVESGVELVANIAFSPKKIKRAMERKSRKGKEAVVTEVRGMTEAAKGMAEGVHRQLL